MKEYKTTDDILKRVGVSRQRVYQVLDYYGLSFPEPDAVVGKRRLYLPETIEKFAENFPTRDNRDILVKKWKDENPDYSSVSDFIRSKGTPVSERKAFSVKIAQMTSAGTIESKQFGNKRIYKTETLTELYDKTYGDIRAFTISKFAEEFAENPTAITLEQFAEATGVAFSVVVSRFYKSNPRPKVLFRVSAKNFYKNEDLLTILTEKDLKKAAWSKPKMSEGSAIV